MAINTGLIDGDPRYPATAGVRMEQGKPSDAQVYQRKAGWVLAELSTEASFYLWHREPLRRDEAAVSFVPVEVVASLPSCLTVGVEILLASKRRVAEKPGFDALTLQGVIAVLEETPSCRT